MRFVKMHGIGNDYVYLDCLDRPMPDDLPALARVMADRHTGVGGDGLIAVCPPTTAGADATMRMFNRDGSEAQMCGNGVRCVAKLVHDHHLRGRESLTIDTGRGPLTLALTAADGLVTDVRVDMRPPVLTAADIPTTLPGDPPTDVPLTVAGATLNVTAVSMGNPHCVVYADKLTDALVLGTGPGIETAAEFPEKTNVIFVRVRSAGEIDMRVWERGSGETLACGTGACAACVAGVLTGRTGRRIVAHLPGGDLTLQWPADDASVFMTGPATEVFHGDWPCP